MEKTFWLSYDISLGSDIDSLYRWLDARDAEECGFGIATFKQALHTNDPATEVQELLSQQVKFSRNDRVYLIWKDDETGRNRGKFIIGHRKGAPWKGYAFRGETIDE